MPRKKSQYASNFMLPVQDASGEFCLLATPSRQLCHRLSPLFLSFLKLLVQPRSAVVGGGDVLPKHPHPSLVITSQ
jgi:hypothetical protein